MDRQTMLKVVEEGYTARVHGDLDGVMRCFAPDAALTINAAPSHPQLAYAVEKTPALRDALSTLINTFSFSNMEIVDSIVEGAKAAVRMRFTVEAKATGKSVSTEVLDIFEFKDGKVVSLTQFCDTAVAAQLTA